MAKSKAAIKSRIKSINTTKKITGAMELISNIKFQRQLRVLNSNKEYASIVEDVLNNILSSDTPLKSKYLKQSTNENHIHFVFGSDLGLCGGYNTNLIKYIRENCSKDDKFFCLGTAIIPTLKKEGYDVLKGSIGSDEVDYLYLKKLAESAINMYNQNEVGHVDIIYTKYINNVTFAPDKLKLLPFDCSKKDGEYKEIIFEPNVSTVLDNIIPIVLANEVYNRFLQAKASEHASRRFAMENATDNANELIDDLTLVYNQARQAAITQEITEIISGADAL